MSIQFKGRVAIVTGAGGGLGRQHALALAARGAKVLVNDLGGAVDGTGGSVSAAQAVVDEIRAAGGEALANGASVTDFAAVQAMVQQAIDAWGRVDILVNNAGILRDKSFAKMDVADFRTVVEVHLMGAVHCCKAVWPHMVAQQYGRIATGLPDCRGVAGADCKQGASIGRRLRIGPGAHGTGTHNGFRYRLGNSLDTRQRSRRAEGHLQHADAARDERAGHGHSVRHVVQDDDRNHRGILHHLQG